MNILVLNSGSSSQKACLYEIGSFLPENAPVPLWEGRIEWRGESAVLTVKNSNGVSRREKRRTSSRPLLLNELLTTCWSGDARGIDSVHDIRAVGHRVVHGGERFQEPVRVTGDVRSGIAALSQFAPLHIDAALQGMKVIDDLLGDVPQFAVFDTGFHRQMPHSSQVYPIPYEWFKSGIRRYGFHGINHQYCATRAARLLGRDSNSFKVVSCHLGNGCSVAAVDSGRSVDTTMGFTPLEGLMMGTRSGSIDPAILIFLMREHGLTADQLDDLLNKKSGLLGISGLSADMRDVLAGMHAGVDRAKLAFELYIHRLRSAIGAMAAALSGVDALVFTAGVGENSPEVRSAACAGLEFMGVAIDASRNQQPSLDADISSPGSPVKVLVIRAEEDWAIAGECWKLSHAAMAIAS